jgi:hypothetical protein
MMMQAAERPRFVLRRVRMFLKLSYGWSCTRHELMSDPFLERITSRRTKQKIVGQIGGASCGVMPLFSSHNRIGLDFPLASLGPGD